MSVVEDFETQVSGYGRNYGPAILFDWWYFGKLTRDDLRAVIGGVWSGAEYPSRSLGQADWVGLFRKVGFVSDTGQPPPTEPMTVHRGTSWGRRRGMAWTTDEAVAGWFADRYRRMGLEAMVFTVTVEPGAVLAMLAEERNESEVVVDPFMLPPVRRPSSAWRGTRKR